MADPEVTTEQPAGLSGPEGQTQGTTEGSTDSQGFTEQQYKELQAEYTKLRQKYKPLDGAIQQLGSGQAAYDRLYEYAQIMANPQMKSIVEQFHQTGRPPSSEDDSFYEEPENEQITALQQQIATLQAQVNQATHTAGRQHVTSMLEEQKKRFGPAWEKIFPRVHEKVEELGQSVQGQQLLANMNEESLNALVGQAAMPIMHEIAPLLVSQEQERVRAMSTGPSSRIATTGREAPAEQKHITVMDAFRAFRPE